MDGVDGTGYLQWWQHAYARLHQMSLVYHLRSPQAQCQPVHRLHRPNALQFIQDMTAVVRQKLVTPIIPVMGLISRVAHWYAANCSLLLARLKTCLHPYRH
jgi:hypothetical protein